MKKLFLMLISMIIVTACFDDDNKNDDAKTIADLERLGKIPSKLDRSNSLTGIDANNNGVRDDVEKYIEEKFPNQIPEAMQFAKAMQLTINVNKKNELELRKVDLEESRAIACLYLKMKEKRKKNKEVIEANNLFQEIRSISVNTKIRLIEHLKFSSAMNGKVLAQANPKEACDE